MKRIPVVYVPSEAIIPVYKRLPLPVGMFAWLKEITYV